MNYIDITGIKPLVKELLTNNKALRDNDGRLIANIWAIELKRAKIDSKQAIDVLLTSIANNQDRVLSASDSITRARRKLQEENPTLRGYLWNERHNKQEDVKSELGYPTKSNY